MISSAMLLAWEGQHVSQNYVDWLVFIQCLLPIPVAAFYVLVAVCIWRAAKYFGIAGKEQKLLRIETGKLAEEVHLLRQELRQHKGSDSTVR